MHGICQAVGAEGYVGGGRAGAGGSVVVADVDVVSAVSSGERRAEPLMCRARKVPWDTRRYSAAALENRRLTATAITESELAGINNAATSGVMCPMPARVTAIAL